MFLTQSFEYLFKVIFIFILNYPIISISQLNPVPTFTQTVEVYQ